MWRARISKRCTAIPLMPEGSTNRIAADWNPPGGGSDGAGLDRIARVFAFSLPLAALTDGIPDTQEGKRRPQAWQGAWSAWELGRTAAEILAPRHRRSAELSPDEVEALHTVAGKVAARDGS
jgi:hypothetical protein